MANEIIPGMGFHHIGLKAADFEKSLAFYQALGMKCLSRWSNASGDVAMLDLGDGGRIELFGDGGDAFAEEGKWVHFAVGVEDVDAAYEKALSIGAEPQSEPRTLTINAVPQPFTIRIAFVKGPDREQLEFFHEVK